VVGGAGLIYAVIIGMWALVLVPMWLRRHDQAQESRAADRFARAMGTLRRGSSGASHADAPARAVLMPGRPASVRDTHVTVTGPRDSLASTARRAADRRRRTVLVLDVVLIAWVTLALLHKVPRSSVVVPMLLLVGFLVVARQQVRRAAEISRRRQRRTTLSAAARAAQARQDTTADLARRGGRAMEPAPLGQPLAPGVAVASYDSAPSADSSSWSAVPTTLPTYVTAPRATRIPRVIDLTTPGSWSGAAMVEKARETLAAEPVAESGMRVESFEIAVPRDPSVRAGVYVEPSTYADLYVPTDESIETLAADDDELDSLLGDPRTGVHGPTWRRAASG
jgi:hypothetical protein